MSKPEKNINKLLKKIPRKKRKILQAYLIKGKFTLLDFEHIFFGHLSVPPELTKEELIIFLQILILGLQAEENGLRERSVSLINSLINDTTPYPGPSMLVLNDYYPFTYIKELLTKNEEEIRSGLLVAIQENRIWEKLRLRTAVAYAKLGGDPIPVLEFIKTFEERINIDYDDLSYVLDVYTYTNSPGGNNWAYIAINNYLENDPLFKFQNSAFRKAINYLSSQFTDDLAKYFNDVFNSLIEQLHQIDLNSVKFYSLEFVIQYFLEATSINDNPKIISNFVKFINGCRSWVLSPGRSASASHKKLARDIVRFWIKYENDTALKILNKNISINLINKFLFGEPHRYSWDEYITPEFVAEALSKN